MTPAWSPRTTRTGPIRAASAVPAAWPSRVVPLNGSSCLGRPIRVDAPAARTMTPARGRASATRRPRRELEGGEGVAHLLADIALQADGHQPRRPGQPPVGGRRATPEAELVAVDRVGRGVG